MMTFVAFCDGDRGEKWTDAVKISLSRGDFR